ncbi:MAG: hypothetical protein HOH17_03805, partial [Halieaceae bacterium]|nr:hypothetical protein [Halieaceae bacterium]
MKWIAVLLGLTAALVTWTVIKPLDQGPAVMVTPASVPPVSAEHQAEAKETLTAAASPPSQPQVVERTDEFGGDDQDRVINIGEPMDPDDLYTWPQS